MAESPYLDPRTPAQLRRTLYLLKKQDDTAEADIDALEEDVANLGSELLVADATVTAGQFVRKTSATNFNLARSNTLSNSLAIGAAMAAITSGVSGRIRYSGEVTRAGWGLTPGARYYLSAVTPGEIVSTPDATAAGEVIIIVGRALTTTTLFVDIEPSILL